jgi:hypothetical protein
MKSCETLKGGLNKAPAHPPTRPLSASVRGLGGREPLPGAEWC